MDPVTMKTYSHLTGTHRMPSPYDVATSHLLFYPEKGLAVATPTGAWHQAAQAKARLAGVDWEKFRDPRETTYTTYVKKRALAEQNIEAAYRFRSQDSARGDAPYFDATWLSRMEPILPVARFPIHGFVMLAAQIGHLAPSGKIVVALSFQAADELRRINAVARHMAEIRAKRPTFGDEAREIWQDHPAWQPLRQLIEELLVTYAWDEALYALNVLAKPIVRRCLAEGSARGSVFGDSLAPVIAHSLGEDSAWHDEWATALFELATRERPENAAVLTEFQEKWAPRAAAAEAGLTLLAAGG